MKFVICKSLAAGIAILSALSLFAAACGGDDGNGGDADAVSGSVVSNSVTTASVAGDSDVQDLKLGYILPQTGSLAYLTDAMEKRRVIGGGGSQS